LIDYVLGSPPDNGDRPTSFQYAHTVAALAAVEGAAVESMHERLFIRSAVPDIDIMPLSDDLRMRETCFCII